MQMLCIVLNREEQLDDLLTELLELEITGATIVDGVGMERVLANDVPIFAGLLKSVSGQRPYNKNILALVPELDTVKRLVALCREVGIDFAEPGTGSLFAIPVSYSITTDEVV